MTYEDFKQLAEHPQHRDVPAIFKLEVLEAEELEEKKRSHYPKYKVNTYCPQAFTTTLEEAEADEFALNATLPNADWKKFMARTRDVVPYKIAPYIQTEATNTMSIENSFSNYRVLLALSTKKDGMIRKSITVQRYETLSISAQYGFHQILTYLRHYYINLFIKIFRLSI